MTWILWLLAAACVIYYVVIVIYSGFTTSFSFIWMVFAAACLFLALGWEYYMKHKDRVPLWLPVSVITFCCTGILVFSMVEILIFTGAASRDASNLDYLIVLGARVKEDGLSKSLKSRLDKAIEQAGLFIFGVLLHDALEALQDLEHRLVKLRLARVPGQHRVVYPLQILVCQH